MTYNGGDGQNLEIVLTPELITELFCDLLDLKTTDKDLDHCCGSYLSGKRSNKIEGFSAYTKKLKLLKLIIYVLFRVI